MAKAYIGNNRVKKIFIGNTKIRKIYKGSTKVWSGASEVSYICNGQTYMQEIDEGDNAVNPSGFVFPVSDAQLLGWTTDPNSTTPMQEIVSTGDPMTVYAIWKYNDNANLGSASYSASRTSGGTSTYTLKSGIDTTKYSAFKITCTADVGLNKWATAVSSDVKIGWNDTGAFSTLRHRWWNSNYPDSGGFDESGYPCYNGATATINTTHANSGLKNLTLVLAGDTTSGNISISKIQATGRTITG